MTMSESKVTLGDRMQKQTMYIKRVHTDTPCPPIYTFLGNGISADEALPRDEPISDEEFERLFNEM